MPPITSISGFSQNVFDYSVSKENGEKKETSAGNGKELSEKEQRQIRVLEKIDADVKAHEAAHQAAAGGLARGKSFGYAIGPDGKQYAVSGEVKIDTSVVPNNPNATIAKMQIVQRAALAPGDSSGQDRIVAAQAAKAEAEARKQATETKQVESEKEVRQETQKSSKRYQSQMAKHIRSAYTQQQPQSTVSYQEQCMGCAKLSSCNHLTAGLAAINGITV